MSPEPLLAWHDVAFEYLGFVNLFLAAGAVGFRFAVMRAVAASGAEESRVRSRALARAATLGLIGASVSAALLASRLPDMAARQHVDVPALLAGSRPVLLQVTFLTLTVIGFAVAAARAPSGWALAAAGLLLGTVRAAFTGQWSRLINPLHELGAGLWIGTLFVLAVVGLPTVLRSGMASERRGTVAAGMIHAFSPFALVSAGWLAVFGAITAVRHLKWVGALWSTPYGWTFLAKLAMVGVVVSLGAYHWKRVRPRLGSESAAFELQRSARVELLAAAVVLTLTAVLVSLPSPKLPGE